MSAALRRRLSALLLSLAAWAALPRIEWCSRTWSEVGPECFVACSVPRAADGSETTSCGFASSCAADTGCDPEGEAAPIEDGDRAWCPRDANAPTLPERDPSTSLRLPAANAHTHPELEVALPAPIGRVDDAVVAVPRSALPRARPPARAPPAIS